MVHSILILGQSNMGGRGYKADVEPIVNNQIYALRNGRWRAMYVPVNPDRVTSGINLVESFADRYQKDHGVKVGIIPCADGGTSIDQWAVGSLLFDHACYMAELAQRTSTIVAVLWHQGESDCDAVNSVGYKEKLAVIIEAFRDRLGIHDVPFILGGLGDYLEENPRTHFRDYYKKINEASMSIAREGKLIGYAPADGLGSNPDLLHFSAVALREFGERYYEVFLTLEDKNRVFEDRNTFDSGIKTEIENL